MKEDFIKFYFHTVGEHVDMKIRELKRFLNRYYLEYEKIVRIQNLPVFVPTNQQPTSESGEFGTSSLGLVCGKRRVEYAICIYNLDARSERTELDIYFEDPRVPVRPNENFNVIAWWKKNSDAYLILSMMARDFHTIPVSRMNSLAPETLEALICAKDWLIGFNDDDEGEPMSGQRMFALDEEEEVYGT